ncbi:MAG: helix-turn-helix transcriptional regulator [Acidimicrobiales bacterium]|nr:helix-turn-helix transcriptional regulator [Acidimicrobiales bacterium]
MSDPAVSDPSITGPDSGPIAEPECSIQRTLDVIGDRWTLLILRDLFRGVRRFGQLHAHLGIARNLLTDRLGSLVDAGIVTKVPYQDRPPRHEYRLTPKGIDLSPALVALMQWGDRWYADDGPPTLLVHDACGTPLEQLLRCPACDEAVTPTHIRSRPGTTSPTRRSTA